MNAKEKNKHIILSGTYLTKLKIKVLLITFLTYL